MGESVIQSGKKPALSSETVGSIIWQCAMEAIVKTILIVGIGSIVVGVLADVLRTMMPAAPPGVSARAAFPAEQTLNALSSTFQKHRFVIAYALVLGLTTWTRLRGSGEESAAGALAQRLSRDWFAVLVGNAFGALVIAIGLYWLEQASISRWVYSWVLAAVLPGLQSIGNQILGRRLVETIGDWLAWCSENQLQFNFWLIYLTAVCDDLGLPNWKSLGRWLWRRIQERGQRN